MPKRGCSNKTAVLLAEFRDATLLTVAEIASNLLRKHEGHRGENFFITVLFRKNSNQGCNLIEMLEKFTEAERLDGGCVYSCAQCNNLYYNQSRGWCSCFIGVLLYLKILSVFFRFY